MASINRGLYPFVPMRSSPRRPRLIAPEAFALIKTVAGYSSKEGRRVAEAREIARIGRKKPETVSISPSQAKALKALQDDSPQAARDALLMCILLDLGHRIGELTRLIWSDIVPTNEHLTFYRPKVHKDQTLRLPLETRATHWSVTASSSIFVRPRSSAPHRSLAGI